MLKKEANLHLGTMLRRGPGIPFHHVVFDPMHGCHNEVNVLLDESVHKHLMVDSPDAEVKRAIEEAQAEINRMWRDANLPKFIQFGKDGQGAHSHALDGPVSRPVAPLTNTEWNSSQAHTQPSERTRWFWS